MTFHELYQRTPDAQQSKINQLMIARPKTATKIVIGDSSSAAKALEGIANSKRFMTHQKEKLHQIQHWFKQMRKRDKQKVQDAIPEMQTLKIQPRHMGLLSSPVSSVTICRSRFGSSSPRSKTIRRIKSPVT